MAKKRLFFKNPLQIPSKFFDLKSLKSLKIAKNRSKKDTFFTYFQKFHKNRQKFPLFCRFFIKNDLIGFCKGFWTPFSPFLAIFAPFYAIF
jgi:hypothetical protein